MFSGQNVQKLLVAQFGKLSFEARHLLLDLLEGVERSFERALGQWAMRK
jgi:hypothetical protein